LRREDSGYTGLLTDRYELIEMRTLSILNHDTAVASAGARMVSAAHGPELSLLIGRRVEANLV
jgi:hypothetical protein